MIRTDQQISKLKSFGPINYIKKTASARILGSKKIAITSEYCFKKYKKINAVVHFQLIFHLQISYPYTSLYISEVKPACLDGETETYS